MAHGIASWHLPLLSLLYLRENSTYLVATVLLCKIWCSHGSVSEESSLLLCYAVSGEWSTFWRIVRNNSSNNTASRHRHLECSEIMVWGPHVMCSYSVVCFMSMYMMQSNLSYNRYFEYYVCTWKWTNFQAVLVSCHLLQNGAGVFLIWTVAVNMVSSRTIKQWS